MVVKYSYLKNFPQLVVIHIVKGFIVVNEAEIDFFFFWNYLAFSMIQWRLAICSLRPILFLNQACTSGSSVHVLLKSNLKDFDHYLSSM